MLPLQALTGSQPQSLNASTGHKQRQLLHPLDCSLSYFVQLLHQMLPTLLGQTPQLHAKPTHLLMLCRFDVWSAEVCNNVATNVCYVQVSVHQKHKGSGAY